MPGLDGYTVKTKRQTQRLARNVSARDHSRGSPLAKATLVAYGDFASPARAARAAIAAAEEETK